MSGFRLRGWHVLASMLGFFAIIIAVNGAFIAAAIGSFPGEDVRRSYLQGLRYNDTLAERRAQAALGWRATAAFGAEPGSASVEVNLRDGAGVPIEGARIEGALERPTAATFDHQLHFTPAGAGRYVARIDALEAGRWRLRARAERSDGARDFEAELTWPVSR